MKRLGSNMPIISLRGISRICLTFGVQNEMPLFLAAKVPFRVQLFPVLGLISAVL